MILKTVLSDAADSGNSLSRFYEHFCKCDNPNCEIEFSVKGDRPTDFCSDECFEIAQEQEERSRGVQDVLRPDLEDR